MDFKNLTQLFLVVAVGLASACALALGIWYGGLHVLGDIEGTRAVIGPLATFGAMAGTVIGPGLVGVAVHWVQGGQRNG